MLYNIFQEIQHLYKRLYRGIKEISTYGVPIPKQKKTHQCIA